ncbi:GCN5-related N-acetyltransferase [Emticicia oligotrophica DSM 17448]|uniref:GCN5-related N-acetyltransferase n=1 Tax=Emticicia oligotrophica (strain DSM 17448 / CIP 109782 / MTCC 6937 / GPTSA100-15) TaxID=929562 RepID=A0ABN4AS88_EMTOG|nr:GNAT family N-acetyltransferase [Emticicia oligotrophica]AFK04826.1 GCN5-related N-acetyltransferase [Emticicia oligotrophica DSM 17448]
MNIKCIPFYELSLDELYEIMVLRQEIFIVEQNCPFVDADGKDQLAWHLMIRDENNKLAAYTRLFDKNVYYEGYTSIGRVVTSAHARGSGIGKFLMKNSIEKTIELFGNEAIKIGAQSYLIKFYQSLGFELTGNDYIEDGIPHTYMIRPVEKRHQ